MHINTDYNYESGLSGREDCAECGHSNWSGKCKCLDKKIERKKQEKIYSAINEWECANSLMSEKNPILFERLRAEFALSAEILLG